MDGKIEGNKQLSREEQNACQCINNARIENMREIIFSATNLKNPLTRKEDECRLVARPKFG